METLEANYADKLAKISNCFASWELRRLTPTVLKSLIVPQLVYILSLLPTNQKVLEELNSRFFKFLWSDRGDKIKRNTMISDYSEDGVKMIHLISFNKALQSTWVKKYLDPKNHGKWKHLFAWQLHQYGGLAILRGNLNKQDMYKYVTTTDTFTMEIFHLWSEISYE